MFKFFPSLNYKKRRNLLFSIRHILCEDLSKANQLKKRYVDKTFWGPINNQIMRLIEMGEDLNGYIITPAKGGYVPVDVYRQKIHDVIRYLSQYFPIEKYPVEPPIIIEADKTYFNKLLEILLMATYLVCHYFLK